MCGESSLLSRKGREPKKRDALISQHVAVVHEDSEGRHEDISAACTPGSCSSSPAESSMHWTQSDPCIIKGNSPHTQEQLCNGCLVWKGLQDTYSPCHHSPQATGASCQCFEIGVMWEPSCNVPPAVLGQVKPSSGFWLLAHIYA